MGHKNQNKHSLVKQVQNNLDAKLAIGHSKLKDKIAGTSDDHIYSWETYRTYLKHCCYFVQWRKQEHGCKTLQECRPYIIEWMKTRETLLPTHRSLSLVHWPSYIIVAQKILDFGPNPGNAVKSNEAAIMRYEISILKRISMQSSWRFAVPPGFVALN